MGNKIRKIIDYLFYCSIPRKDYNEIKSIIWSRNRRVLRITSILSTLLGSLLLVINIIRKNEILMPYILLSVGSLLIFFIVMIFGRKFKNAYFSFAVCYSQMVLTIVYAVLLSIQPRNANIPATSVIVFIALLPISIDDRPIRMYAYMTCEAIGYLIISSQAKSPEAFSLDVMNTVTFGIIGLIIYSVVCFRNVKEIS